MKTLTFTPQNIQKIKRGEKTCTSRTFRLDDGIYRVDDDLTVEIKGYYYSSIYDMKDYNKWAWEEGYKDWQDMYENCTFRHTRDFMDGYRDLWVYTIEVVK